MLRGYVPSDGACGDNSCTTSDRYVKILDLREGNEESSEEITAVKPVFMRNSTTARESGSL